MKTLRINPATLRVAVDNSKAGSIRLSNNPSLDNCLAKSSKTVAVTDSADGTDRTAYSMKNSSTNTIGIAAITAIVTLPLTLIHLSSYVDRGREFGTPFPI